MFKRILLAVLLCLNVSAHHVLHEAQSLALSAAATAVSSAVDQQATPPCDVCSSGSALNAAFTPIALHVAMVQSGNVAQTRSAKVADDLSVHTSGRAPPHLLSLL